MSRFSFLESAELSDVGQRRSANEDAILSLPDAGVYCVADGVGGAEGGAAASRDVVDALQGAFNAGNHKDPPLSLAAKALQVSEAVNQASHKIKNRSEERQYAGSGTTVVTFIFDEANPNHALALHAGDSCIYRLRQGELAQLTRNHTYAESMGLEDHEILHPRLKCLITRAVGVHHTVSLEKTPITVKPGDLYVVCSDGLYGMLSNEELTKLLNRGRDDALDLLANNLVREANKAGGLDNISVILVAVKGD